MIRGWALTTSTGWLWTLSGRPALPKASVSWMGPDPARWKREDYDRLNQHPVKAIRGVPNMIMDLMLPSMLASPDHDIGDLIAI
jgi:hypothetical protein